MQKLLLLITTCFVFNHSIAQTPTLQQKLFYTSKVWGFVKYYHSNVSTCHVNWDSVLLHTLPLVRSAGNDSEFNDAIDTMLSAAGTMALATTAPPTPLPLELRRNLNFGWLHDTILRSDVRTQLDTIKNNFRPHGSCYVSLFSFPLDDPMLDITISSSYPDSNYRQVLLFKYWNVINYFYPYNYILDKPEDTILYNNIIPIDVASNDTTFFMAIRHLTSYLDDAHVGGATYSNSLSYSYWYLPKLMVRYIDNKYVIVKTGISGIHVGDAIVSVNGLSIVQMEDSMKKYVSAGNISVFRRFMYKYLLLGGPHASVFDMVLSDPTGVIDTVTVIRNTLWGDPWLPEYYYPADSLSNIRWTTMQCGIGYMNLGNMSIADADSAYAHLRDASAIIMDYRNYPVSNAPDELSNLMYASQQLFELVQIPDTSYPGTYYWDSGTVGITSNAAPYLGTIILLFNEETQSFAEVSCVSFCRMPHVVKIGSQTAGAYGTVVKPDFSRDIHTGFTYLAMYYPNGDSIQRIGIIPDSVVKPTVAGIMAGRDELVEKALQVGCSQAEIPPINNKQISINIYPNPANEIINIVVRNIEDEKVNIQIQDIAGRVLLEKNEQIIGQGLNNNINTKQLPCGVYILRLRSGSAVSYTKFTKI